MSVNSPEMNSRLNMRSLLKHVGFSSQGGNSNLNGGPYFLVSLSMALNVMTGWGGSSSSITIGRYGLANVGASSFKSLTCIYRVAAPVCGGIPTIEICYCHLSR